MEMTGWNVAMVRFCAVVGGCLVELLLESTWRCLQMRMPYVNYRTRFQRVIKRCGL